MPSFLFVVPPSTFLFPFLLSFVLSAFSSVHQSASLNPSSSFLPIFHLLVASLAAANSFSNAFLFDFVSLFDVHAHTHARGHTQCSARLEKEFATLKRFKNKVCAILKTSYFSLKWFYLQSKRCALFVFNRKIVIPPFSRRRFSLHNLFDIRFRLL